MHKTIKEIATELQLSEKNIATHGLNLARNMSLGANVELTRYSFQH